MSLEVWKKMLKKEGRLENKRINSIFIKKIQEFDEKGHKFDKTVELLIKSINEYTEKFGRYIISFGGFSTYYIKDFKKHLPSKRDLCVDIGGRNHRGSPVYVHKDDFNECVTKGFEIIEILKNVNIDDKGFITLKRCQICLSKKLKYKDNNILSYCNCKNSKTEILNTTSST